MYNSKKTIYTTIEFYDISGLVKGASKGEGLGNRFLSHIREVDAVVHVVRCFENGSIIHVNGSVDPMRDVDIINMELVISDLEIVDKRIDRVTKLLKGDRTLAAELEVLSRLREHLDAGNSARSMELTPDEEVIVNDIPLLSRKPVIYVANIGEDEVSGGYENNPGYIALKKYAEAEGSGIIPICAGIEAEIAELEGEDRAMFLEEMGLSESGLDRLIKAGYSLLGLISFLTAGPKEVRAWTIKKGTKAPQAAGKIHSDFERGFIRAEVIAYDDLIACGSMAAAKEKGLVRSEGKDYVMKDGDIVLFRFNV